jgi:MFS family permease
VGLSNYLLLTAVPVIAQAPASAGSGFGTSVVVAGLALLPFSAASVLAGRLARLLADRGGRYLVLPVAALVQAVAFALFGLARSDLWQLFLVMAVAGLGVGASFAAFPALVVSAVPPSETGSAMSLNQVLRYVGFALGSALTATVLPAATPSGAAAPAGSGYTTLAVVGVAVCATTAVVAWLGLGRHSPPTGLRGPRPGAGSSRRGSRARQPRSASSVPSLLRLVLRLDADVVPSPRYRSPACGDRAAVTAEAAPPRRGRRLASFRVTRPGRPCRCQPASFSSCSAEATSARSSSRSNAEPMARNPARLGCRWSPGPPTDVFVS